MYLITIVNAKDNLDQVARTLIDVTAAEGRSLLSADREKTGRHYERVDSISAHYWVRCG